MNKWLASLPSTNARVAVTLFIAVATAGRYLLSGIGFGDFHFDIWEPSWDWLLFIAGMSGLDLASFYAKRKTDTEYIAAKQPTVNVDTANVQAAGGVTVNAAPAVEAVG